MPRKLGDHTVTVIRKTKVDRLSSTSSTEPDEHDLENCAILPASYLEQGRGWVYTDDRQIFAPPGSDILGSDQVRFADPVDGVVRTWAVSGGIAAYEKNGRGKAVSFYVERVGSA